MILFDQVIFGPIRSRRLGISLGVNLLPIDAKICSYNCIYCECGFNTTMREAPIPTREQVKQMLGAKLEDMRASSEPLDVITFAGNGEPTLHADFAGIIDDTIELRNKFYPEAKVSVLSNSTRIGKPEVFNALLKVDNNILKFDSAIDRTYQLLDQPVGKDKNLTVDWLIEHFKQFNGKLIIQTMFTRGEHKGEKFDNTTDEEITAWLNALEQIRPSQVMIYTLDRKTPIENIERISLDELNSIANRVRQRGFDISVAG
ncbi:radical SAM protein [Paludibacter sp. 221]|uniref:radical SAM protein n=1 Tax=Paludibacter sp. 221 TaxID=2302939 RepID=UPI0013D182BF|nr:radical SAM protein [Paludibacter sp. 221]NDV46405.1 radical SAM protein [Paludibacter sp. 221]